MKQYIFTVTAFILFIIYPTIITRGQWEKVAYDKQYLFERPKSLSLKSSFIENGSYSDWDLTYNRLELTVDPSANYIKGKVQFTFTSLTDNLNYITFDLDDSLKVSSITCNRLFLNYTHENGFVSFKLPMKMKKNETGSFTVSYEGTPSSTGLGSFTQSTHNNIPVIFTLSEP